MKNLKITLDDILNVFFILGLFLAIIGLLWLLIVLNIWLYSVLLPLGLIMSGLIVGALSLGISLIETIIKN